MRVRSSSPAALRRAKDIPNALAALGVLRDLQKQGSGAPASNNEFVAKLTNAELAELDNLLLAMDDFKRRVQLRLGMQPEGTSAAAGAASLAKRD